MTSESGEELLRQPPGAGCSGEAAMTSEAGEW